MNYLQEMGIVQWRVRHVAEAVSQVDEAQVIGEVSSFENDSWQDLEQRLSSGLCSICQKSGSLFGAGSQSADWLFLCQTPSKEEVELKQFFTGRQGQLFEAILHAIGLSRGSVYTTSLSKCVEATQLSGFMELLDRQIALLAPKFIVVFGESSAQSFLKSNESLATLQASKLTLLNTDIRVIAAPQLQQLLDEPKLKAQLWKNLKRCLR